MHTATDSVADLEAAGLRQVAPERDDGAGEITSVDTTRGWEPLGHLPVAWVEGDVGNFDEDAVGAEIRKGSIVLDGEDAILVLYDDGLRGGQRVRQVGEAAWRHDCCRGGEGVWLMASFPFLDSAMIEEIFM